MNRFPLVVAAAAALGLAAVPPAFAQAPAGGDAVFRATTLNLSAYGETRVRPDQATITLGVVTQGSSAAEAMRLNRERMTGTVAALKAQGLAERDIQTSSLDLQAQYAYEQGQAPRLTGYQASNQVSVTVRDLARLGAVVDAVVQAGANQVAGISFSLADPTAAEDAARRAAVKALAAKAALYAQATGYRIGRLVNLSENGGYTAPPPRPLAMARMAAEATPVQPGELKVRIEVNGTYELAR
jgi:uncharacterized protein YggE